MACCYAGLTGFDRDFSKAAAVEAALGVPVLRHSSKKPAGGTQELQERFGCEAHEIVCVGDRSLTDIVFGNRNGLLTIQACASAQPCVRCGVCCAPSRACAVVCAVRPAVRDGLFVAAEQAAGRAGCLARVLLPHEPCPG